MKIRRLVIEVDSEQPAAGWVWESMPNRQQINGLTVVGISEKIKKIPTDAKNYRLER